MKYIFLYFLFFSSFFGWSQISIHSISNQEDLDYGVGLKLNVEFGKFSNFQLGVGGGIGYRFEFIYPNAHVDVQVYKGGIGSSLLNSERKKLHFDLTSSFGVIAGIRKVSQADLSEKFNPINYFGSFSVTPLNNPFWNSLYAGTNLIWFSDKYIKPQRVGTYNINVERTAQLTYYNDKSGFPYFLADGNDRYHTGGGGIYYYGKYTDPINFVKVTFSRFTAFQPYAFDSSNQLQIDHIAYKNEKSFFYNQGRLKLTIGNYDNGFGVTALVYNWKDIQNLIHFIGNFAYHPNTEESFRIMLGGEYSNLNFYE